MQNQISPEMAIKALRIVAADKKVILRRDDMGATVRSENQLGVEYDTTVTTCTCPAWARAKHIRGYGKQCKHTVALKIAHWAIGTALTISQLEPTRKNLDYIIRSLGLDIAIIEANKYNLDIVATKAIAYVKKVRDQCPYCGSKLQYEHDFFIHRESVFGEKQYGAGMVCRDGCQKYAHETERQVVETTLA